MQAGTTARRRRIVVAIDDSEPAAAALKVAGDLARDLGAELHACHAIDYVAFPEPLAPLTHPPAGAPDVLRQEGERIAARARETMKQAGVAFECHLVSGSPGEAIVDLARSLDADMIAIGTHGRTGLARAFLGSVADYVIRNSGRPTLTVAEPRA
jgi:nucleotide-binding universal stress UspA family protein